MIDITLLKSVLRHADKKLTNDCFSHATELSFSKLDAEKFYFIAWTALSRLPPFKFYRLFTARCKHIFHIYVHCFRLNISWMFCMNRSFNRTNGHIQKPKALNVGFNFILCEKKFTLLRFKLIILYHLTDHHIKKQRKIKPALSIPTIKLNHNIFNLLLKKDRTRKIINTVQTKCKLEALLHFLVTWEKYIEKALFEEIFDWKTAKVTT